MHCYRLLLCIAVFSWTALSCSSFCLSKDGSVLFGKNYDWHVDAGYVIANKRTVEKVAIAESNPATWVSKYGSVTFNQFGREMPSGGMNEKGLVVELMWLSETSYPAQDDRPAIGNLQWIQYQLDNSATVEEVIARDADIRIAPRADADVHYLICDATGACAAIESLHGKMVAHTGSDMPAKVLTNDTYEKSVAFLKKIRGYGGMLPMPNDGSSHGRFVRLVHDMKKFSPKKARQNVKFAFNLLENVSAGDYTKWSIVYDVSEMAIHFHTFERQKEKIIEMAKMNFLCTKPVYAIDINTTLEGDVSEQLIVYTPRRNRLLVDVVFSNVDFLAELDRSVWEENWNYPKTTKCREGRGASVE